MLLVGYLAACGNGGDDGPHASDAASVPDPATGSGPADWFKRAGGGYIYYLQMSGATFAQITADIDEHLGPAGYAFVLLYVPYDGDAEAFAGLGPRDYFSGGAAGSIAEFETLVSTAHAHGMAVWMWANLGYSLWDSPYYLKALDDRRAGVPSHEARSFAWTGSTDAVKKYWGFPAFDWESVDWQEEARKVLAFWLDRGMDGFVFDYWPMGINQDEVNSGRIENQVYGRGNKLIIDEPNDYEFDWEAPMVAALQGDGTARPMQPYQAATAERLLEPAFDEEVQPSHYVLAPPALFVELAIDMMNILTPIDDFNGYNQLTPAEKTELDTIVGVVNRNRALNLDAQKLRAPTDDQDICYVEARTAAGGGQMAIAAFNFTGVAHACDVDVSAVGLPAAGTTVDLTTGAAGPAIEGGHITIDLPAFGYQFLEVTMEAR